MLQKPAICSERPHSSYETIKMARPFHLRPKSGWSSGVRVSLHSFFASSALWRQAARVKNILEMESIGSPRRCSMTPVSTLGPSGGRGNCESSCKSGNFQTTIRFHMSEIGYAVHPVQRLPLSPEIRSQAALLSIRVFRKKMSPPFAHVSLRWRYTLLSPVNSNPFVRFCIVPSEQFIATVLQGSSSATFSTTSPAGTFTYTQGMTAFESTATLPLLLTAMQLYGIRLPIADV